MNNITINPQVTYQFIGYIYVINELYNLILQDERSQTINGILHLPINSFIVHTLFPQHILNSKQIKNKVALGIYKIINVS